VSYAYSDSFFDYVTRINSYSATRITSLLASTITVRSVLDVGCGPGLWLSAWRERGARDLLGIDGAYVDRGRLRISPEEFESRDLGFPFRVDRKFDLVQSLEVAEHLPPSRAESFVADLAAHGGLVLFSAAPPGQGGENHVNERPYEYWRRLFSRLGYEVFDFIRPLVRDDTRVAPWYRYNTLLFADTSRAESLPESVRLTRLAQDASVPDVSPWSYRVRKRLIRTMPFWVRQELAKAKSALA
jgi:SAM-dependent methyltransferase